MFGFLEYWREEAQGLYRQVPDGDDISNREKHNPRRFLSLRYIVQTVYQIAPFLLLLNLVIAAIWTVKGLSHVFGRPRAFAPNLSSTTMILEENATFMAPSSPESDAAWKALRPKGGGAVTVPNARAYGLGPGIPMEKGADVYGVSMFHQLHCLIHLRASYHAALNGTIPPFTQPGIDRLPKEKQVMLSNGHIYHCFDYIRQSIMCGGDLTIESATEFPKKWLEGISEDMLREQYGDVKPVVVDGWGMTHQCRNFDEAWDWTYRNRVPDDSGLVL